MGLCYTFDMSRRQYRRNGTPIGKHRVYALALGQDDRAEVYEIVPQDIETYEDLDFLVELEAMAGKFGYGYRRLVVTRPGMDVSYRSISGIIMPRAMLRSVYLGEYNLDGANLKGSDLSGSDLSHAKLFRAKMSGSNLTGADLRGANLIGADLGGAIFDGADLRGANLSGADLSGSFVYKADTDDANFYGAYCSSQSSAPVGWNRNDHGLLVRSHGRR